MSDPAGGPLPIDAVLDDLAAALGRGHAVLAAPPGSGKTTRVPLALREAPWLAGRKILMLEPRRPAARLAALRMASLLGEPPGASVGYQMRFERCLGPDTRIQVLTEGILTRRLQRDPALEDVGLLIFDEFHERTLTADLGLALALDTVAALRPDLRLLVMSATLDTPAIAARLGGAPVIRAGGRAHPIAIHYAERPLGHHLAEGVADGVRRALAEQEGDLLVFLPGAREIEQVRALLAARATPDLDLLPLHGGLTTAEQDRALRPTGARGRRVVLATDIAETSVTIEGVTTVVDCGLTRKPCFDPGSGLARLVTEPIALASATQRAGRAGRLGPGTAYRLWTRAQEVGRPEQRPAEILQADLAPLALELALWGVRDPGDLQWLDPPPAPAWAQAVALLRDLGALDAAGALTRLGRRLAELPVHPRLAAAARLSRELAGRLADAGSAEAPLADPVDAGALLALAYPDRIAQQRGADAARYRLAAGPGARLAPDDPLARHRYLVVADLDAAGQDGRIRLALPIAEAELRAVLAERLETTETLRWDREREAVAARHETRLGTLVLAARPQPIGDPTAAAALLLEQVAARVDEALAWGERARQLQARVALLRRLEPEAGWPDLDDAALRATLADWLGPWLVGRHRLADVRGLDLAEVLTARLAWPQRQRLDQEAPEWLTTPAGTRRRLDYGAGEAPVLAVPLQELFGAAATPTVAGGRVAVMLHLLSPARRPVQVTRDLTGFWARGYPEVRKELRGRYPKHHWPEDPTAAAPVAGGLKRRR